MDSPSAAVSCSNVPSIFSDPFSPQPYSLANAMVFDDHVNTFYPFPVDQDRSPTNSSMTHISGLRPRRHSNAPPRAHSRLNSNLPFEAVDGQIPQVAVEREWKGRPIAEESARRRREQNRASQRAYRERRDRHVEELEERNRFLQQHASALLEENNRLRRQLSLLLAPRNRLTNNPIAPSSVSSASSVIMSSLSNVDQYDEEYLEGSQTWDLMQDC